MRSADPLPSAAMNTRKPSARSCVEALRPSASVSPTTGSNALAASTGVSGLSGAASTGTGLRLRVREQPVERQRQARRVVSGSSVAPHVFASVSASAASSSSSSCARSRSRRGSNSATTALDGQQVGQQVLVGR